MWKYETPEMEIMYFDEDIRTNVIDTSTGNVDFIGPNGTTRSF